MQDDILAYNKTLTGQDAIIAVLLAHEIMTYLPDATAKLRHGHPVWFLNGNPVLWYSTKKAGIALLFRSGQSFDEPALFPIWKFKAAEIVYASSDQINRNDLVRWLGKTKEIQRDYKNIVKRKWVLERLI